MESPNNGHIGDMTFVRCREMSASRRLLNYYMYGRFIHSVTRGLSVVEGLFAFRSVRFGRLYCISILIGAEPGGAGGARAPPPALTKILESSRLYLYYPSIFVNSTYLINYKFNLQPSGHNATVHFNGSR